MGYRKIDKIEACDDKYREHIPKCYVGYNDSYYLVYTSGEINGINSLETIAGESLPDELYVKSKEN